MKKIADASIFDGHSLKKVQEKDGCTYFCRKNIARYADYLSHPPLSWAMYYVDHIYEEQVLAGNHYRRENSGFLAVEYIREGSLYVRQNGRMYLAEAGDVCLLHPHCNHEFLTGPEGKCTKFSLLLIGPLLEEVLEQSGLKDTDVLSGVDTVRLEKIIKSLKALSFDFGDASRERLVLQSCELIQLLLAKKSDQVLPEKLLHFIVYLNENLAEKLTLRKMACRYGCSVPHLIRVFRMYFNTTPYRMLTRLRMRTAVRYLEECELSVKEISEKVGYGNAFNFSTEFRKEFGVSPRHFRLEPLSVS